MGHKASQCPNMGHKASQCPNISTIYSYCIERAVERGKKCASSRPESIPGMSCGPRAATEEKPVVALVSI